MDRGLSYGLFCRVAQREASFAIRQIAQAHLGRLHVGPRRHPGSLRCGPEVQARPARGRCCAHRLPGAATAPP
ncbi:MAG: hypothetical protein WKF75_17945 [Singulisphaera sp.]